MPRPLYSEQDNRFYNEAPKVQMPWWNDTISTNTTIHHSTNTATADTCIQYFCTAITMHKIIVEAKKTRCTESSTVASYRCGKSNHSAANCRFKTAKCHKCGCIGHIKINLPVVQNQFRMARQSSSSGLEDKNCDAGEYDLFALDSVLGRSQPFMVNRCPH